MSSQILTLPTVSPTALRSNGVSSIGTLYVSVDDVDTVIDAGSDQTVNQNATVQFTGSASKPIGANDALSYAWDFDYDGENFNADPSANGTLTPTHVYTTPGTYEAALQVTDAEGSVTLATTTITVNDVPPTATVTNSGSTPEGSAVTFTLSNLTDQTPNDTPTILADWTGSGTFEELTSDELTTNPDGSTSFTNVYDEAGTYNAVIRVMDGNGGSTDYTTAVTVTEAAPSAEFGQAVNGLAVDSTAPILFTNDSDPSLADTQAGFTYYVSLDGGAYTSSSSPAYYFPSGTVEYPHTLSGYVVDSEGQRSPVSNIDVTLEAPQVMIGNTGSGTVQATWTGGSTTLGPNQQTYLINGTAANLTFTMEDSNESYKISTNGTIASVVAAAGVTNVNLTVSTLVTVGQSVGDGSIGEVDVPTGSTVQVESRGDLGSIVGPSVNGTMTGTTATDVVFANLLGSITGLDSIQSLTANGWLGTSASQEVEASAGIQELSAYGIGAKVQEDLRQDAGDPGVTMGVGDGGIPNRFEAGNVSGATISGAISTLITLGLGGGGIEVRGKLEDYNNIKDPVRGEIKVTQNDLGTVGFLGKAAQQIPLISVRGSIDKLVVKKGLTVKDADTGKLGDIDAGSIGIIQIDDGGLTAGDIVAPQGIGTIQVTAGNLTANNIKTLKGSINTINLENGDLNVSKLYTTDITKSFDVKGDVNGVIEETKGTGKHFKVTGNFIGGFGAGTAGKTPVDMTINGEFRRGAKQVDQLLTGGSIPYLQVDKDLGGTATGAIDGEIKAASSIGTISAKGNILLSEILAENGDILQVSARSKNPTQGKMAATVKAVGGNIIRVIAREIAGNIIAVNSAANKTPQGGGNIFDVNSTDAIPASVKIRAAWYIYRIQVTMAGPAAEEFSVSAQGGMTDLPVGGQTNFQSQGPLIIDVGASDYLGTVQLAPSGTNPATYKTGATLLTVIANNKPAVNWTIAGNDQNPTTVQAKFAKLKDGTFGDVKKSTKLSREALSIQGPSGDAAN